MLKIYKYRKYYYVKDNDTLIVKFLLNYKCKNNKIYFRKISKVRKILEKNNINYIYNNKVHIFYENNYYNILNKYMLINEINNKLISLIERRNFNKIFKTINE